MSNEAPRMPDPVANGSFIPTLDGQGAVWLYVDAITQDYLDFVAQTKGGVLEIGAGYGHMVNQALERGASRVFANEIDDRQIAIVEARTPRELSRNLVCCLGRFPEDLSFARDSFDGIYSARVIHFFDGNRLRAGLARIREWLKPGGRVFLVSDSIYRSIFKPLIPIYEKQRASGAEWPGFMPDVRSCIPEDLHPEIFPRTMNFLDPEVMARELTKAGLGIVTTGFYPYTGSFALGRLDGRELCGAIAVKQ